MNLPKQQERQDRIPLTKIDGGNHDGGINLQTLSQNLSTFARLASIYAQFYLQRLAELEDVVIQELSGISTPAVDTMKTEDLIESRRRLIEQWQSLYSEEKSSKIVLNTTFDPIIKQFFSSIQDQGLNFEPLTIGLTDNLPLALLHVDTNKSTQKAEEGKTWHVYELVAMLVSDLIGLEIEDSEGSIINIKFIFTGDGLVAVLPDDKELKKLVKLHLEAFFHNASKSFGIELRGSMLGIPNLLRLVKSTDSNLNPEITLSANNDGLGIVGGQEVLYLLDAISREQHPVHQVYGISQKSRAEYLKDFVLPPGKISIPDPKTILFGNSTFYNQVLANKRINPMQMAEATPIEEESIITASVVIGIPLEPITEADFKNINGSDNPINRIESIEDLFEFVKNSESNEEILSQLEAIQTESGEVNLEEINNRIRKFRQSLLNIFQSVMSIQITDNLGIDEGQPKQYKSDSVKVLGNNIYGIGRLSTAQLESLKGFIESVESQFYLQNPKLIGFFGKVSMTAILSSQPPLPDYVLSDPFDNSILFVHGSDYIPASAFQKIVIETNIINDNIREIEKLLTYSSSKQSSSAAHILIYNAIQNKVEYYVDEVRSHYDRLRKSHQSYISLRRSHNNEFQVLSTNAQLIGSIESLDSLKNPFLEALNEIQLQINSSNTGLNAIAKLFLSKVNELINYINR